MTSKMAAEKRRRKAMALLFIALSVEDEGSVPRKRNRKLYMREWIARRKNKGIYHQLVKELEVEDLGAYRNFFRITRSQFRFLTEKVSPIIAKKEQPYPLNHLRPSIKPDERLAVTLRYLATGETLHSLEYSFRISRQAISAIIIETCNLLCLGSRLF